MIDEELKKYLYTKFNIPKKYYYLYNLRLIYTQENVKGILYTTKQVCKGLTKKELINKIKLRKYDSYKVISVRKRLNNLSNDFVVDLLDKNY